MPSTYTSRYIDATARSLPADLQEDVREELAASIADAVEARLEQGEDPAAAERAVLTELGDPAALAAGYADRPLHLIGPRYYLTWLRLLKTLVIIVVPLATLGAGIAHALAGAAPETVIGEAIGIGLSVAVHLFFWVTLVFVVLERTGTEPGTTWDVDQLPEERSTGTGRSDLIASLVFLAIVLGALLWDRLRGLTVVDGEILPVLDPALWPVGILPLLGFIVLEAVLAIVIFRRGRWDIPTAVVNTLLAAGFAAWSLTLLGQDRLVNPELVEGLSREGGVAPGTLGVVGVLLTVFILVIAAWDTVDGWIKTARDRRRHDR